jgi:hypothetical protein
MTIHLILFFLCDLRIVDKEKESMPNKAREKQSDFLRSTQGYDAVG